MDAEKQKEEHKRKLGQVLVLVISAIGVCMGVAEMIFAATTPQPVVSPNDESRYYTDVQSYNKVIQSCFFAAGVPTIVTFGVGILTASLKSSVGVSLTYFLLGSFTTVILGVVSLWPVLKQLNKDLCQVAGSYCYHCADGTNSDDCIVSALSAGQTCMVFDYDWNAACGATELKMAFMMAFCYLSIILIFFAGGIGCNYLEKKNPVVAQTQMTVIQSQPQMIVAQPQFVAAPSQPVMYVVQ